MLGGKVVVSCGGVAPDGGILGIGCGGPRGGPLGGVMGGCGGWCAVVVGATQDKEGRSGSSSRNPVCPQNKISLLGTRVVLVESPLLKSQTSCGIGPLR